jgi:hypothetical protein
LSEHAMRSAMVVDEGLALKELNRDRWLDIASFS